MQAWTLLPKPEERAFCVLDKIVQLTLQPSEKLCHAWD